MNMTPKQTLSTINIVTSGYVYQQKQTITSKIDSKLKKKTSRNKKIKKTAQIKKKKDIVTITGDDIPFEANGND